MKAKILLRVEKLDSQYVPYDVNGIILRCNAQNPGFIDCIQEEIQYFETETHPLPTRCAKLKVGEYGIYLCVIEINWTRYEDDSCTEINSEIIFHKIKTLKKKLRK